MMKAAAASEDKRSVQRYLHDVVALFAAQSMWLNYEPHEMAEGLSDVLRNALNAQIVYVALKDIVQGVDVEAARIDGWPGSADQTHQLGQLLEPYITASGATSLSISHPFDGGTLRVDVAHVEAEGRRCLVIAGSADFDFPEELDHFLLEVAAGQAATLLKQSHMAQQLQQREQKLQDLEKRLLDRSQTLDLLKEAAVAINEAETVEEAVLFTLRRVSLHTGWPVGHAYRLADDNPDKLVPTEWWHVDSPERFEVFRQVTEKTHFAAGEGLPGQVLATAKPAWITDVNQDPDFIRTGLARDIGVKAGFAFPVLADRKVVAVLEFFSDQVVEPDEPLLEVMAHIGTQLGRVIERTHAQKQVRERERQLAEAQRLAHLGSWEWDITTNALIWSDELYRIYGLDPQDAVASYEAFLDKVHPDDQEFVKQQIKQAYYDHQPFEYEHRLVRPDGSVRTLQARGNVVLNRDGQPIKMHGTGQDITERKEAEEQIRALNKELEQRVVERTFQLETLNKDLKTEMGQRERAEGALTEANRQQAELLALLESLLEHAPLGFAFFDQNHRYIRINKALAEINGLPVEAHLGRSISEVLPVNAQIVDPIIDQVFETGEAVQNLEVTGETPAAPGVTRHWLTHFYPIMGKDGPLYVGVTVTEITERKRAEDLVRQSEQNLRNLIDNLFIFVGVLTTDGILIEANKAALEAASLQPADVLGKPFDETYWWAYSPEVQAQLRAAIKRAAAGEVSRYDVPVRLAENRLIVIDFMLAPVFDEQGQIINLIPSGMDITERKQAEDAMRESYAILHAVIEGTGDGIYLKDRDGRYLMINSAGAGFIGKPVEEVLGKETAEVFPPNAAREIDEHDRLVMTTGEPHPFENVITINGETRTYHTTKAPYFDTDGHMAGVIGISRDITEMKQAESFNRLLAKAGEILASSLDYSTRLDSITQLAVPHLADWCAVSLLEEDESIRQVTVAHVDPSKVALAEQLQQRYPPDETAQSGVPQVLRSGQSEFYPEITDDMLQAAARDADHLQILRDTEMRSAMVIPLRARGRTLGAMTFVWAESGRRYTKTDLALAEELGRRAGLAIDNARLYNAEREARRSAEWIAKRIAGLQAVTAALSEALTPDQVASAVVKQGISVLDATSGLVALLDESGECLEIVNAFGYPSEQVEAWRRFPLSTAAPLAETVRTGELLILESQEALSRHFPEFAKQSTSNHQMYVTLPLTIENRTIGGIGLSFAERRSFSSKDSNFMLALARQCAQALERARLYEAERTARTEAEGAQQRLALLAEEKERNRLAQELHDNVAQALGYLNLKLAMTVSLLTEGQIDQAQVSLQELKQVVSEVYTDVREEIFDLRSKIRAGLSFLDLLDKYIDKYRRFYRLDIRLEQEVEKADLEFPAAVSAQVIRIIQEALINVRKHAKVDRAVIRIKRQEDQLHITVEDKGRGFDIERVVREKENSFGLSIMRERVESIGGKIEMQSVLGEGTQVVIWVPL